MRPASRVVPAFLALLACLPACDPGPGGPGDPPEGFRSALSVAGMLELDMAGALAEAGGPPTGPSASPYRDLTLGALAGANRGLALLREPLEWCAAVPGQAGDDPDRWTWRAPSPDGTAEAFLEVRRWPGPWYTLALALRPLDPAGAPWQPLAQGTFSPSGSGDDGQGALWADLSADLDPGTAGTQLILWTRADGGRDLSLFGYDLACDAPEGLSRNPVARFREGADGSGDFLFRGDVALPTADGGTAVARDALIHARWNAREEGRVDVKVEGSVAEAQGFEQEQAIQCWKTHGKVTTYDQVEGKPKDRPDKPEKVVVKEKGRVEDCPYLEPVDDRLPVPPEEPPAPRLPDDLP